MIAAMLIETLRIELLLQAAAVSLETLTHVRLMSDSCRTGSRAAHTDGVRVRGSSEPKEADKRRRINRDRDPSVAIRST